MLKKIKDLNEYDGSGKNKKRLYQCECGTVFKCLNTNVNTGNTKSCGCLHKKVIREVFSTHKLSKTKTYRAWVSIKRRCTNKNSIQFENYGGRGISVCKRWLNSFEAFLEDMGHPPTEKHTIDRICVDKDYTPDNCKWSTTKEQANNKTNSRYIEYNNEVKTLTQWAELYNLSPNMVWKRLHRGWSIDKALNTPKLR